MFKTVIALISGILFGAGMIISHMVDPVKVISFLDITGNWDPSLAFVMGGALAVFTPAYHLLIKKTISFNHLQAYSFIKQKIQYLL